MAIIVPEVPGIEELAMPLSPKHVRVEFLSSRHFVQDAQFRDIGAAVQDMFYEALAPKHAMNHRKRLHIRKLPIPDDPTPMFASVAIEQIKVRL